MRKILFALALLLSLSIGAAAPNTPVVTAVMQFQSAHPGDWSEDPEVQISNVDADHYFFKDDESVDLGVIRDDNDLSQELNAKGKTELVRQIIQGQNAVNHMFDVGETKILDSTLTSQDRFQVLSLHSKQDLPDGSVERLEKYFIARGQTLHVELRWRESADAALIASAKSDFENSKVEIKEVTR